MPEKTYPNMPEVGFGGGPEGAYVGPAREGAPDSGLDRENLDKRSVSVSRMTVEERNKLIEENLPLVRQIAHKIKLRLPSFVDPNDLISAGTEGLVGAAVKFDPDINDEFSAYAKHRIQGAILDTLRELDWLSRDYRKLSKKIEEAVRQFEQKNGRKPNFEEIGEFLKIRPHEVEETLGLLAKKSKFLTVKLSENVEDKNNLNPEQAAMRAQLWEKLSAALGVLDGKRRRVIELYYRDEKDMDAIAELLEIGPGRASQLHKDALKKIKKALKKQRITTYPGNLKEKLPDRGKQLYDSIEYMAIDRAKLMTKILKSLRIKEIKGIYTASKEGLRNAAAGYIALNDPNVNFPSFADQAIRNAIADRVRAENLEQEEEIISQFLYPRGKPKNVLKKKKIKEKLPDRDRQLYDRAFNMAKQRAAHMTSILKLFRRDDIKGIYAASREGLRAAIVQYLALNDPKVDFLNFAEEIIKTTLINKVRGENLPQAEEIIPLFLRSRGRQKKLIK